MIKIINRGPTTTKEGRDPGGWRNYAVFVNQEFICLFKHKRIDGMGICLKKASKAVAQILNKQMELKSKKSRGGNDNILG